MAGSVVLFQKLAIAAPGANTSFGSVTLPPGTTRVEVSVNLATGSVFKAVWTDGTNTSTEKANGGTPLTAGVGYTFTTGVAKLTTDTTALTVSGAFQVETDGIISRLTVTAIVDAAA